MATIPDTMRATTLRAHGGPEVLNDETLPAPAPGPGEVLVRVAAVAMNHMDLWVRKGLPGLKLSYPHLLGCDVAGTVAALGVGAGGVAVGDAVVVNPGLSCGRCRACLSGRDPLCRDYRILGEHVSGGYAELVAVPAQNLLPSPAGLSPPEAAAVLLVNLTAWQMLVDKARVQPGETVLVIAAGSGVGTAAVQIAKLFGARVIATAGSDAKLARARELGADETLRHDQGDWVQAVRQLTGKRGVDVVFEHVGGETLARAVLATASGGRIVTCGATAGPRAEIDVRHVFYRQISILGSTMGSKGSLWTILEHVAARRLRPVIDRVLPLSRAREAHAAMEQREQFGKIVLLPGQ